MVSLPRLNSAKMSWWPGGGELGPEQLPFVAWRAQREAVVRRHERAGCDGHDAAFDDLDEIALVADLDQERGGEETAAPNKIGVGVYKVGNAFDHFILLPSRSAVITRESG